MEGLLWPIISAIFVLAGTYYYFVVMNKPKKLASVPAPMVKKGTAAAQKRKPLKKKEEVRFEERKMALFESPEKRASPSNFHRSPVSLFADFASSFWRFWIHHE